MGGPPSNFAAIVDGLSNTIFLSELIIANRGTDVRGAWAYPVGVYFSGGSRFNNPPTPQEFLLPNGNALDDAKRDRSSFCSSTWATDRNLRCLAPTVTNRAYQTARSRHTGGVQVARGDGSVAFLSNSIELLTWQRLLAQADGNTVSINE
jgi:prepilin-type processing-associated H-X9-DG protein